MSAVSVSQSAGPVLVASAGIAGGTGVGGVVVTGLPVTGPGMTTMLLVMAASFLAVGWVLTWNPLGRGRHTRAGATMVTLPRAASTTD